MLQQGKNILFGAYIYYAKIAKPSLRYGLKPVQGKPHMNREYVLEALLTEEDYAEMKKRYKTVKAIKEVAEYTAQEFEEKFKVKPPYEADTYYVVKFKKSADYKDGNAAERPKIGAMATCKTKLTPTTEFGNGTVANIMWREREWLYEGKKGVSLDLAAIAIVDLVEYSRNLAADFGDGFVELEDDGSSRQAANDDEGFGEGFEEVSEDEEGSQDSSESSSSDDESW